MKREIMYINYFHKLSDLSQQLDNYAYTIKIIDSEFKRTLPVTQERVTELINDIENIYNEIKDVNISVFIESLVLKKKKVQKYFYELIEGTCKRKEKNLRKILAINDVGLIYDNQYTQCLHKEYLMKEIFLFVNYNNACSAINQIKQFIEKEDKANSLDADRELTLKEIALIHIYEEKQITRDNGDEIANNYGYKSGESLYQKYTYYSSASNRKGRTNPFTKKKMENKIKLFEGVVHRLSGKPKTRALDELTMLKNLYKNEF